MMYAMKELALVFRFLIAPASTWEILKENRKPIAEHEKDWFYPMLAITAATAFVQMFYGGTLISALIRAIALFTSFFLGSVLCPVAISYLYARLQGPNVGTVRVYESDIKIFVMFNLAVLAIVAIVQNLLPTPLLPLYILPIYLLFVISKCSVFFHIKIEENKLIFIFGAFAAIILIPLIILLILWQFIPQDNL